MPKNTEYVAGKGIIVITYTDRVTIQEVREATVKAIAIQKDTRTDRVVIDALGMTVSPSISEMWELVQSYPELEVPRQTRLAAIRPRAEDKVDLTGFFEVICQNRCYCARGFSTRKAAEKWVLSDQRP